MLTCALSVFPLTLKCLYASGEALSTSSTSAFHLSRTMKVWSRQFFYFILSSLSNLGFASYPVLKNLLFPNCFSTGNELHRVVQGLGTWILGLHDWYSNRYP